MNKYTELDVHETAARLGVHESTVRNWVKNGVFKSYRMATDGTSHFSPEEIEKFREKMIRDGGPFAPPDKEDHFDDLDLPR